MTDLLLELCRINAVSGNEKPLRDYITAHIGANPYTIDPLGNLIVEVKGKKPAKNKVMLCAHMDEVGVMARYVRSDGLIKFATLGGIQPSVLAGRQIEFLNGTRGVTGVCPVHLLAEEKKRALYPADELYIDIGCTTAEDTLKYVRPGDAGVIFSQPSVIGDKVLAKAIDDRAGCAVMLEMINEGVLYDTVFVFSVQEEVGLRGAGTAAFSVAPDCAIVLEATTAADIIDVPEEKSACILGKGAAVSFMDNQTVYPHDLYTLALKTAEKNGIAAQPKTLVAGGNDAGVIHKSRGGVRTITLSVPCRYIHSPSCMCDINDVRAVKMLAQRLSEEMSR